METGHVLLAPTGMEAKHIDLAAPPVAQSSETIAMLTQEEPTLPDPFYDSATARFDGFMAGAMLMTGIVCAALGTAFSEQRRPAGRHWRNPQQQQTN